MDVFARNKTHDSRFLRHHHRSLRCASAVSTQHKHHYTRIWEILPCGFWMAPHSQNGAAPARESESDCMRLYQASDFCTRKTQAHSRWCDFGLCMCVLAAPIVCVCVCELFGQNTLAFNTRRHLEPQICREMVSDQPQSVCVFCIFFVIIYCIGSTFLNIHALGCTYEHSICLLALKINYMVCIFLVLST